MRNKINTHRDQLGDIKTLIERRDRFLVTTHIHPDGDSIASVLLFGAILRHFGKTYAIVIDDPVPRKFDFLPGIETVGTFEGFTPPFEHEAITVLDASTLQRIGRVRGLIRPDSTIIHIDHHPESERLGGARICDSEESSTVELVYYLAAVCGLPVTPEVATLVYTGIMCDTGRFLFPNITHRSLEICSDMVRKGARPGDIAERIYFRNSPDTIRALSSALSTLEFHFDGSVSSMHLNHNSWQSPEKPDTEGFIDHLLTVEGTEVEFFMLKLKPGLFKISFRSKSYVDVNEVAKRFGGGGHARAAGCTIEGEEGEVKRRILEVLEPRMRRPVSGSGSGEAAVRSR
jgi:bifunctional oligoribonuclease and PAP phosphatase NrnA